MTENGKLWLAELRNSPKFRQVMKEFKELRPVVPQYKPQSSLEASAELMEKIKYESGRRDGFDIVFLQLIGEKPDG